MVQVEIFHKQIKQYLGFEDVAPKYFPAVETHVSLVYCAYLLLQADLPGRPQEAATILEKKTMARILQRFTQFGGVEAYKDELKAILSGLSSPHSLP